MSIEEGWPIVRQMCEALDAAHQAGVIHRDFKPSNVLLVPVLRDGVEEIRAVITDFGLARVTDSGHSTDGEDWPESVAVSGRFSGTPAYMAPEQIQGLRATALSDIYAFGLVLYEMITGNTTVRC